MRKDILICLEKLGIGGVETAVVNQAIALKEKGCNVFVIAQKGVYSEILKQNGVTCIEWEFKLENKFDNEKIEKIIRILKENNIGQVHIHQFPCILQVWYACALLKIPYVAYLHSGTKDIYEWYEKNHSLYNSLLKTFFENSYKIIAVSKGGADSNKEYYNLDEKKYIILKNSINFNQYKSKIEVKQIKRFIILARIAPEKMTSIKNGIELFTKYQDYSNDNDIVLDIYGDGPEEENLKKYISEINSDNKYNINLKGATNDVQSVINEHDVVLAIGRCILEAMAMKRIAIISGNSGEEPLKFIVKEDNIYEAIEQNFSGNVLKKEDLEDVVKELNNLNEYKIKEITDKNYNIIYEKLNIQNNVYCIAEDEKDNTDYNKILWTIFENQNNDIEQTRSAVNNLKEDKKRLEESIENYKTDIDKNIHDYEKLKEEINNIYNSKRWKYINKIAKIFDK